MDEFDLIRRFLAPLGVAGGDLLLGIGDDCALVQPPPGDVLAISTDSLIEGRHFPVGTDPAAVGWKALAVNLSDLAAMGATPRWFTLALTLERADADWLAAFAHGLGTLARAHGIRLIGGDTTRGPLQLTLTVIGSLPAEGALRRSGAQLGDAVCVSGTLGDAAHALNCLQAGQHPDPFLRERLDRPQPRVALGLALRGRAHAAIDLSDGLVGDLQHVLDASGVGAMIELERLPVSPALARARPPGEGRWACQVAGGDDYELCFCLPEDELAVLAEQVQVPLTRIGTVVAGPGLRCVDASGATIEVPHHGYRHFE